MGVRPWLGVCALVAAGALASGAFAVTGANTTTTIAGRSQFPGFAGDGGPATRALFGGPARSARCRTHS